MSDLTKEFRKLVEENRQTFQSAQDREATIWLILVIGSLILSGLLFIGGILLAVLGGTANTEFILFGQTFKSTSIGVALAFIGTVMFVLTLRYLKSFSRTSDDLLEGFRDAAGLESLAYFDQNELGESERGKRRGKKR